jgi:hypothetical protein
MLKPLLPALLLALTASLPAQEIISLTTPVVINRTGYHLESMMVGFDTGVLQLTLASNDANDPTRLSCAYTPATTPTGAFLNTALQKANLSSAYAGNATTGSLKQRVAHRLVVMGEAAQVCGQALVGTLTGSVP